MKRVHVQTEEERVRQLRLALLVHSYLYYQLDETLISDHQWQALADELVVRQKTFTRHINCYDEAFKDWNASTGFHLPVDDWVRNKGAYLLRIAGRPLPTQTKPRVQLQLPTTKRRSIFED